MWVGRHSYHLAEEACGGEGAAAAGQGLAEGGERVGAVEQPDGQLAGDLIATLRANKRDLCTQVQAGGKLDGVGVARHQHIRVQPHAHWHPRERQADPCAVSGCCAGSGPTRAPACKI